MRLSGIDGQSRVGRRLLRRSIAFGLAMALFASSIQAWISYRAGLAAIRQTMEQIGETHAKGVSNALWDFSNEQLALQIEGMLNFPFLNYVAVRGDAGFLVEAGVRRTQDIFEQEIPLSIVFRGQPVALGSLYLQADTSLVLRTVMAQVTNVLLFQSAMVALVVAFFYLLFQGMVTCHLATIAQYFKTFDMERTFTPLSLAKRRRGDEFDILADTFNAMHERVLAMYQEVLAAQQAAKAGEERLNMALDASGAGIWDVDYDIRRIHLGVRDKDIFGNDASGAPMTFEDWAGRLHPDDLPAVRQKLAAIHRNETETLLAEYRYTSGPGQYRWMHVRGRVTRRGPHGKILRMVGIMMDLTERMLIQQSLNEKERFASTVIESLPGLFVMFDSQMRVVRWNRNFAGLVGLAHENPEAVEILRFIPEVDRARLVAMVRQALARGLVATEEVRITAGGGELRHYIFTAHRLDADGEPRLLCNGLDITVLKKAEQDLRKTTNVLDSILEAMPSAIIGLDERGRVTLWNQAAMRLAGVPAEKALGMPLSLAFSWLASQFESLETAVRGGDGTSLEKLTFPLGDETRMVDVMLSPIAKDGLEGAVVRLDDVTGRVHMEEMMVQSEKMISVGGLAAGMAHEINNPLGVILQFTQNIERRLSPDLERNRAAAQAQGLDLEALGRYLDQRGILAALAEIRGAGERAAAIIRSMLKFSRKSESQLAPCDLASVIDAMIDLVTSDFDLRRNYDPRKVRFVRDYHPLGDTVLCTENQLGQVVFNILKNAIQALAAIPSKDREPVITARVRPEKGQARIELEDNGPGLSEAVRKRVFEPFFTTKTPGEGTGLGMSVSYYIITNNHKGRMFVESEPGRGTRFVILLPMTGHRGHAKGVQ